MELEIGPVAYVALGIAIAAAGTVVAWMTWQLVDLLRHG
jgi:uncharacterized membrane protein YccC